MSDAILPSSEATTIDIVDLSYGVHYKGKPIRILKHVNISFTSGQLYVVMGPSGSGKSTLLDLVSDRKIDGFYSGEIRVNGKIRNKNFGKHTAYVLQTSLTLPMLTVEETIYYSVWSRVASLKTREARQHRVDELLKMLDLEDVRNTRVGNEITRGVSGGQLKRLSIAIELVHLPDVIFLDEPTSGLDSKMSLEVMTAVKEIVGNNRICISTIHSPSPQTFALFDHLVLLADGRVIFSGPLTEAIEYFSSSALGYRYTPGVNPAEYVISISNGKVLPDNGEGKRTADQLEDLFENSELNKRVKEDTLRSRLPVSEKVSTRYHQMLEETSSWTQLAMLFHRGFIARIRDVADLKAHFLKNMIVGLLVGVLFYKQADISPPFFVNGAISPKVTGMNAILFLSIMFGAVSNIQSIPMLCDQSALYRQEVAARAYRPIPYWFSSLMIPVPFLICFHLVFFIAMFFLVGFPNSADFFFKLAGIAFLHNMVVFALGFFLAAVAGSSQLAIALYPITFILLIQFAGFLINIRSIPPGWMWAPYLSFSRWALQGLMIVHWSYYGPQGWQIVNAFAFDQYPLSYSPWVLFGFFWGLSLIALWRMIPPKKNLKRLAPGNTSTSAKYSLKSTVAQDGKTYVAVSVGNADANDKANVVGVDTEDPELGKTLTLTKQVTNPAEEDEEEVVVLDTAAQAMSIEMRTLAGEFSPAPVPQEAHVESVPLPTFNEEEFIIEDDELQAGPCDILLQHVTYSVPDPNVKDADLTILNDVSGQVHPGEMCALMGASGAGKSTLLDLLAQRKNTGKMSGQILYNNATNGLVSLAYVLQDNVHMALLTVRETIYYAALLRLPEDWPEARKVKRVNTLLKMLSLEHVAENTVGNETIRGISGGQLKRLSIAVEIIHLPAVLFLDEPTTGLDSATAYEVIAALRRLANKQRTIVATIHQPSSVTFAMFDKLMLLAKGKVVYFGSNRQSEVVDYFTTGQSLCQFHYDAGRNPAEFIIDIVGGKLPMVTDCTPSAQQLAAAFAAYQSQHKNNKILSVDALENQLPPDETSLVTLETPGDTEVAVTTQQEPVPVTMPNNGFTTSTLNQVRVLLRRGLLSLSRDRAATVLSLVRHVIVSVFFGTIYFQLQTGSSFSSYTNRMGLLYFNAVFFIITNMQALPVLLDQRILFYRERGARAYGAVSYWLSVWMMQVPVMAVNVLVYAAILYNMVGLRSGAQYFFYFYYVLLLMSLWSVQLVGFIASMATSTQTALSYFPIMMFINVGFAGYLIFIPRFPDWLGYWGPYISIMRFAFQSLIMNEFQNNPDLPLSSVYLHNMGFDTLTKTETALILIPFYFFFNLAFLFALKYVNFEKR